MVAAGGPDVAPGNAGQLTAWDGTQGAFRAAEADRTAARWPGPFSLADPARIRQAPAPAGHRQVEVEGLAGPEWWGADPDEALAFALGVAGRLLDGLDLAERERAVADLRRRLAAHAGPDGVELGSAAWLVTARRP